MRLVPIHERQAEGLRNPNASDSWIRDEQSQDPKQILVRLESRARERRSPRLQSGALAGILRYLPEEATGAELK